MKTQDLTCGRRKSHEHQAHHRRSRVEGITWEALEEMYEKVGPSAIYEYAMNNPQQFEGWSVCDPCSNCPEEPVDTPTFKLCCAVCGQIKLA